MSNVRERLRAFYDEGLQMGFYIPLKSLVEEAMHHKLIRTEGPCYTLTDQFKEEIRPLLDRLNRSACSALIKSSFSRAGMANIHEIDFFGHCMVFLQDRYQVDEILERSTAAKLSPAHIYLALATYVKDVGINKLNLMEQYVPDQVAGTGPFVQFREAA